MARVGKSARMPQGGMSQGEGEKPLAATLFQEFQNLKEKFKNEDDEFDSGKLEYCWIEIIPLYPRLLMQCELCRISISILGKSDCVARVSCVSRCCNRHSKSSPLLSLTDKNAFLISEGEFFHIN